MLMVGSFRSEEEPKEMDIINNQTSSSISDTICVTWGCELNGTKKMAVFEVEDDLLEHQFFIHTICLGADSGDEVHVVEVKDRMASCSHPVPIATLCLTCLPMVSFSGFELVPPVTFKLCSGKGPVYIMGKHIMYEDDVE